MAEQAQERERESQSNTYTSQEKWKLGNNNVRDWGREKAITQETFIFSTQQFPLCQNKKTTIKYEWCCCEVSPSSLSVGLEGPPHPSTSRPISPVIHYCTFSSTVPLPFPKHTLSWHLLEKLKCNIKHKTEFMECKWEQKSNLLRVSRWKNNLWGMSFF